MDNNLLSELDQYIKSAKTRLQTILTTLDWTVADSLKASTCSTRKEEEYFNRNDPPLPESFGCNNSVVIDENQLQSILQTTNVSIAKKFSGIQLNFTREQKCELYDHVIANTAKTSEPELKVSLPNDQTDNAMTFAEIVAKAKKKEKKLQRKYRTSKPTHIEEVRNLVSLQMQALDKYFNPETETKPDISRYKVTYEERFHDYRRSRHRDHLKYVKRKSRSRSSDERSRNYHNRRRSDKREETTRRRSRSYDRNNRFSKRKSPSIERRKHSHERRKSKDNLHLLKKIKKEKSRSKSPKESKSKDDLHLVKKIKKEKVRSKSPKKKKKHKHHRKH
ncbi:U2 snRNP-associated SURP motif-containing protein [Episyrphus balteatus]|uniref:U2 snRNP-associated SURP motif-containing protein n=1 Tax=Episyrphus balteatus TaxID=286459 RepID=UPI002486A60C|nr:U2 snRNP-associated SURP motif-containing protein [Episyrphus balteatus]